MMPRAIHVLALAAAVSCANPEQVVPVASDVAVPRDTWVRLSAPVPLRTRGSFNEVCLAPAPPFELSSTMLMLQSPARRYVLPRARVVDLSGHEDSLTVAGMLGTDFLCLGAAKGQALRPRYAAVHVWSPDSLVLQTVEWRSTEAR